MSTVRATHFGTDRTFEIGPGVDPDDKALAEQLYMNLSRSPRPGREIVECREHDDSEDPELVARRTSDGLVHDIYIYLRKLDEGTPKERWVVVHFDGRASHFLRPGKSAEHKREQDEWCNAADAAGYEALQEERLPKGGRADVLIVGPALKVDIEVQRSHQKRATALARTRRNRTPGIEPIWAADRLTDWNRDNAVPNVRTTELPEGNAPKDLWRVIGGVREVHAEQCTPRNGGNCLKLGRGKYCRGWHPRLLPPEKTILVYEVAERAPANDLVRLDAGRRLGFPLVTPADRDLWLELTGQSSSGRVPELKQPSDPIHRLHLRRGFGEEIDRHIRQDAPNWLLEPPPPQSVPPPVPAAVPPPAAMPLPEPMPPAVPLPGPVLSPAPVPSPLAPVPLAANSVIEPPLHRPRPCPACGQPSRAIVDGRCLVCRMSAE